MQSSDTNCPKCGRITLKGWRELTGDELMLAKSLPASAEYTLNERKKHRICTRCWFESVDNEKMVNV